MARKTKPAKKSVSKAFAKHANCLMTEGGLLLVLSVLMLTSPTYTLFFLIATLGVAFTVFGIYYLIKSLFNQDPERSKFLDIIFSLMPLGLGVILIMFPQLSFTVFITLMATVFFIRSIYFFVMSVDMINIDTLGGILGIFVSLVSLLLAGVIIIYPITAAYAITIYMAISLLFYAICDIIMGYRIKRVKKYI